MADSSQDRRERLFVGAPISQGVRTALVSALPTVLPGKVIDSDKWHFTLRFLGSTTAAARAQVIQYLKTVACGAPFQIRFSELGAFPNAGRARILWVGIDEGAERMIQLAAISE